MGTTFANPVQGPRIIPFGESRRADDLLPNGRPAFALTQLFHHVNRNLPAPFNTQPHAAIDLGNFNCHDLVVACGSGKAITWVDPYGALGVTIDHGGGWTSIVGHLDAFHIPQGRWVEVSEGQALGIVGDTGLGAVCHLHFEVRFNGVRLDPLKYLRQFAVEEIAMLVIQGVTHVINRRAVLAVQARFRPTPRSASTTLAIFPAGESLVPVALVTGDSIEGDDQWYEATLYVDSIGSHVTGFFHRSVVGPLEPIETVKAGEDPRLAQALAEKDAALDRILTLRFPELRADIEREISETERSVQFARSVKGGGT